jgi:hypothetical protein
VEERWSVLRRGNWERNLKSSRNQKS